MLARCEKLDLCQNVFVDGKWGAYRCCPLQIGVLSVVDANTPQRCDA